MGYPAIQRYTGLVQSAKLLLAAACLAGLASCGGSASDGSSPSTSNPGSSSASPDLTGSATATVTLDSALPAAYTAQIQSYVSGLDEQPANASKPTAVAVSIDPSQEGLVLATDSNSNILLAAYSASGAVTLNADSTALAFARIGLGAPADTAEMPNLVASLRATPHYAALTQAILAAIAQNEPPASQAAVSQAISDVVSDLSAATAQATRTVRAAAAIPQPRASAPLPFTVLRDSSSTWMAVTLASLDMSGLELQNTFPIVWGASTSTAQGAAIPPPPSASAPVDGVTLLPAYESTFEMKEAAATAVPAFSGGNGSLTLAQTQYAKQANVHRAYSGIAHIVFKAIGLDKDTCEDDLAVLAVTQSQLNQIVTSTSADLFIASLKSSQEWTASDVVSAIGECANGLLSTKKKTELAQAAATKLPKLGALLSNFFGVVGKVFEVKDLLEAGLVYEDDIHAISATIAYWNTSVTVGVCTGNLPSSPGGSSVVNCAATLMLSPAAPKLSVGASFNFPAAVSAVDAQGQPTAVPSDLVYTSDTPSVLSIAGDTATAQAVGSANVTAYSPSLAVSTTFMFTVVAANSRLMVTVTGVLGNDATDYLSYFINDPNPTNGNLKGLPFTAHFYVDPSLGTTVNEGGQILIWSDDTNIGPTTADLLVAGQTVNYDLSRWGALYDTSVLVEWGGNTTQSSVAYTANGTINNTIPDGLTLNLTNVDLGPQVRSASQPYSATFTASDNVTGGFAILTSDARVAAQGSLVIQSVVAVNY